MATSKTLNPTNVSISIPALGDAPDASVFSNCIDKEADAINALNSQIGYTEDGSFNSASSLATLLNNALSGGSNKRKLVRFGCTATFDCFVTGVSYFVDLKVSSNSYSSCIMQGVGYYSVVIGTLANGTWSFREQIAPSSAYTLTPNSDYIKQGTVTLRTYGRLVVMTTEGIVFKTAMASGTASNNIFLFTNPTGINTATGMVLLVRFNSSSKPLRLRIQGAGITPWWEDIAASDNDNLPWYFHYVTFLS